jgi:cobalamin biosynthesis protein CbiD
MHRLTKLAACAAALAGVAYYRHRNGEWPVTVRVDDAPE